MKNKKKVLVMSSLLVAIVLLGIGTIAYFRRTINGDIIGQTGNLVLIVNEANAVNNESFSISLKRSEDENFIMPDDKGVFNLNIDSTGSSTDVDVTITISRVNLPDNLKFYLDEDYAEELTTYKTIIPKSEDMTKAVPVYWFWYKRVSDENDSDFINKEISADVTVSATIAKTFYDILLAKNYTLDTNVNFIEPASETNGQGLMMVDGTQNDQYPILYYRNDYENSNVIYNGYCWRIVRTTETGGIKLVLRSLRNFAGACDFYGSDEYLPVYVTPTAESLRANFNENYDSPVYVGYMYNDDNLYFNCTEYDYEYGMCINGQLDIDGYKLHLEDNTIDQQTGRHTQNLKDSSVKKVIDEFYSSKIAGKTSELLLEDTVWCNDRSITSTILTPENYATNGGFSYSTYTRFEEPLWDEQFNPIEGVVIKTSLNCPREIDSFTVEPGNGNGDLDYPIGLLTMDEVHMFDSSKYIENGTITMSPLVFMAGTISIAGVNMEYEQSVNLSVSLKNKNFIIGGDGSKRNPYRLLNSDDSEPSLMPPEW